MKRLSCLCGWGNFEPLCLPLDFIFLGTVCIFIKIKPFFILKRWWCEFVIANRRGWMTWSSRKWLPGAEVLRINQSFYSCFPSLLGFFCSKSKLNSITLETPNVPSPVLVRIGDDYEHIQSEWFMHSCKVHALYGILVLLFVPVLLGQMFPCGQSSVEEYREGCCGWKCVC